MKIFNFKKKGQKPTKEVERRSEIFNPLSLEERGRMVDYIMSTAEKRFNLECHEKSIVFTSFEDRDNAYQKWYEKDIEKFNKMSDAGLKLMYRAYLFCDW